MFVVDRSYSRLAGVTALVLLAAACTTTPKVEDKPVVAQPTAQAKPKPPPEPTASERFAKAKASFDKGDCNAAIGELGKVLQKEPQNAEAQFLLALCQDRAGAFDEASASYKKVLEADPKHEGALLNLGLVYKRQAKLDEAIALYSKALEADPENVKVRNNLGVIYRVAKKYPEAEAAFRRVLARKQGDVDAYKNFVVLFMEQGKLQLAEQFSLEARKLAEKDAGILNNYGLILFRKDPTKPTRALNAFLQAVEIDPNLVPARLNVASIALRFRDYKTAAEHAGVAVNLEPNNWEAHLAHAYALDGERKVPEAVAAYDKVLELRPGVDEQTADIVWSKAMLYKGAKDWKNAQDMLAKYKGMEGLNAKYLAKLEGEMQGVDYMLKLQNGGGSPAPAPSIGGPGAEPAPEGAAPAAPEAEASAGEPAPGAPAAEAPAAEAAPAAPAAAASVSETPAGGAGGSP